MSWSDAIARSAISLPVARSNSLANIPPSRKPDRPAVMYTRCARTSAQPWTGQADSMPSKAPISRSPGAPRNRQTHLPSSARRQ
jgi:hypothetical protein